MASSPNRTSIINNNEGCVLINRGIYDKAIAKLHKALLHLFELQHLNRSKTPGFYHQRCNADDPPLHYYPENDYDEGMGTYSQPFFISNNCDDEFYGSTEGTVYFNLGLAHARNENYSEALLSLKMSLKLQCIIKSSIENNIGATHQELVINGPALHMILHNIGHMHFKSARYTEAFYSYTQALDSLMRDSAENHRLDISSTLNCIAVSKLYANENNTNEILTILKRALALRLDSLKPKKFDRESATIINNSGRVRFIQGEFATAFKLYKEAYKERVATLGEDHVDVAACLVNMAQAKEYLGEVPEAIDFYKQFLDIALVKRGCGRRDVTKALLAVGQLYYNQRLDLHQAHKFFSQALDSAKVAASETNDVTVAKIYNRIGNVLFEQSKFDLALEAYSSGLAMERVMYQDQHDTQIATTVSNLARVHRRLGNFGEAIKFYKEAIDIKRHLNDPNAAAEILIDLGSTFDAKGDTKNAINAVQEAVAFFRVNRSNDTVLPSMLNILGLLQHKIGSFTLALCSCLEAIKICWTFKEVPLHDITAVYCNAAAIYKKIGESDMALRFYLRVQKIYLEKIHSEDFYMYCEHSASVTYEIGMIFKERDDFDKALSYLKQSSEMCIENPSMIDSMVTAKVFMALADLYILIGDADKAMESYLAGIEAGGGASEAGIDMDHQLSNVDGGISTYLYKRLCQTNPPGAGAA